MDDRVHSNAHFPAELRPRDHRLPVVVVTGLSGAGLSTAMKCLEDQGYEAVDNLRLSLLMALVSQFHDRPLAVGIDSRTRDFNAKRLLTELQELRKQPDLRVSLLFMDATDEALQRRYMETRRPHPMAADRQVQDGIAAERAVLAPLKHNADMVLDTTDLSIHDARRVLSGQFHLDDGPELHIFVTSFAFRHGVPREADLVFDVRFLDNPHWDPRLRPMTGLDEPVQRYIEHDPDFNGFFDNLTKLLSPLLPRYAREGKYYLTVAVGCTGGRHRSVFTVRRLVSWLREHGYNVQEAHRDVERKIPVLAPERSAPAGASTDAAAGRADLSGGPGKAS